MTQKMCPNITINSQPFVPHRGIIPIRSHPSIVRFPTASPRGTRHSLRTKSKRHMPQQRIDVLLRAQQSLCAAARAPAIDLDNGGEGEGESAAEIAPPSVSLMSKDTMSCLIDGLPDEVAIQCLARVPFYFYPHLQLVCRSWRDALRTADIFKARNEVGASEELLCVLAFEPENVWQLYDPLRDRWLTLPIMPSEIRHLARFGVASVGGKLFVIGGGSDGVDPLTGDYDRIFASNEVWSFDPLRLEWSRRAPMLVRRAMFACCALDGKIIVAGGFTNCREWTSKAEIYDPEMDVWEPLPDLRHTHSSACSGVVTKGKMHVLHKGLSTVQILEDDRQNWAVKDYGWLQGPMAMVHGELYVLSHGCIFKQHREHLPDRVVSSATEFQSRIGFGMIGLRDEIYVIGGVIGPGPRNQCIKPLSDVDALNVRNERPTWRSVSPMTNCHGTILGCAVLRI